MISVIVLVRNAEKLAHQCLRALKETQSLLHMGRDAIEYILIDDCSDPQKDVPGIFRGFGENADAEIKALRFREHQHYAYGLAMGLSLARGDTVFFVSHDMIVTPACVKTLLEVGAVEEAIGIVRPLSAHMDGGEPLVLSSPLPMRTREDVMAFSRLISQRHGVDVVNAQMLIGDALLIKRSVIDKIGVFDTRFRGFMADIDYGLRAQRAGFRAVMALGAWLHHEGGGTRRDVSAAGGEEADIQMATCFMRETEVAYEVFRAKWGLELPARHLDLQGSDFTRLCELPELGFDLHQPPLTIDPGICEVL